MNFVLLLLLNAGIILLVSKLLPAVVIRNYATAISVALVIGILNATVGFLLRLPLNLITLFFLTFLVRLLVTAIVIKIAAIFFSGFKVETFSAALILAVAMAIAGAVFEHLMEKQKEQQVQYMTGISDIDYWPGQVINFFQFQA